MGDIEEKRRKRNVSLKVDMKNETLYEHFQWQPRRRVAISDRGTRNAEHR